LHRALPKLTFLDEPTSDEPTSSTCATSTSTINREEKEKLRYSDSEKEVVDRSWIDSGKEFDGGWVAGRSLIAGEISGWWAEAG